MIVSLGRKLLWRVGLNSPIARNSIFLLAAEVVRVAANFIVSVVLGRYLEPERFGIFRFVVNYAVIFAVLTDAGISRVSVRRMARTSPEEHSYLLATLRKTRLALSIGAFCALCISLWFLPAERVTEDARLLIAVYMLSQIFQAFRKDSEVVWQARQQLHYHAALAVVNRLAILAAVLWAVHTKAPLTGVILCYVAVDALDFIVANSLLATQLNRCRLTIGVKEVKELVHEAVPFGLQFLAQHLRYYADAVLLKFLVPLSRADKTIGLYNSATPFVLTLQFIPTSLAGAVYPELAKCYVTNRGRFCQLSKAFLAILYAVGTGIACILFSTREWVMARTFGFKFLEAAEVLAILAWFLPFFFLSTGLLVVYAAADRQKILSAVNWSSTLIKLIFSFFLVPAFDKQGLAWASLIAEALSVVYLLVAFSQTVKGAIPWKLMALVTTFQGLVFLAIQTAQPVKIVFWSLLVLQGILTIVGAYILFRHTRRLP
ncbi:MAG: flippase [Candidatus Sumerlaeaceae bacterium]|nr:flippase [Candidatus Sumerlaeaceae bacterium]